MYFCPHILVYYSGFVQENTSHSTSSGHKGFNTALGAYTVGRAEGAELGAAAAKEAAADAGGLGLERAAPERLLGRPGGAHICAASGCHRL